MEYQISLQSPLGIVILKSDGKSVTGICFSDQEIGEQITCEVLQDCKEQLDNYFSGKVLNFDLPLHPEGTEFQIRVWAELMKIPYGSTITYLELSEKLGDPKAVRAVGTSNGRNPIAIVIPCHRVIGAGNKLTGYAGGLWRKQWLLAHEIIHNPSKNTLF